MFTIDSIPDHLVEEDEKARYIKKEIKKHYSELTKQTKTVTEIESKIGERFNTLKEVVKKSGNKWTEYIEDNFSYINIRTAQRWMKLAKAVDIENHPSLAYAGQTRLLTLANLAKRNKAEVDAFLKDSGVSLDFKTEKRTEVGKFRDKVDDLIKKHSPPKDETASANSIINRLLKAAKELIQKFENDNDEEDVTESVDKKTLENSIEEVEELLQMLKQIKKRFGGRRNRRKQAA